MGSSKKHKERDREREHKKKKKHRSRSRSRDRKRHRHERPERDRRERDRQEGDDDLMDSDEYYPKELEDIEVRKESRSSGSVYQPSASIGSTGAGDLSLSIEETNRIRAKLGLKPLEVNYESKQTESGELITQDGDIHRPAISLTEKKETEKLKEKIEKAREKRKITEKLSKIKTLGESDSEDDTSQWVKKSRQKQKEKEMAEKRAKQLMELDEEFGIGNLVDEEFRDKSKEYTSKDLKGLKVEHALDRFKEGQSVILTLQDKGILDDDDADTLVNVNMIDEEKSDKYKELKKKKPDYNPYDTGDVDEYGMFKVKEILDKYDEEISGPKKEKFELGAGGKYNTDQEKQMDMIRAQLRQQSQLSAFLTPQEEQAAKFKKVKKKVRKIRKKQVLKADDLLPLPDHVPEDSDYGSRHRGRGYVQDEDEYNDYGMDQSHYATENGYGQQAPIVIDYAHGQTAMTTVDYGHGHTAVAINDQPVEESRSDDEDLVGPDEDLTNVVVEEDEAEKELHSALTKARRLKQRKETSVSKVAEKVLSNAKSEMNNSDQDGANIVLNATSEFCRTLGDIPTYGQSGNRDEEAEELLDFEKELEERRLREEEEDQMTGWNRVEIDETPVNITGEEQAVLDDEPVVSSGVGAALELAKKKGYIEKNESKKSHGVKKTRNIELEVQNYSIEDKRYDDLDEKYSRKRDRYGGGGITQDFKEKDGYKPDIKLEYVDDSGRMLNQKEAFRQLSHRFHGKGSGKKKTEKRGKKQQEEQLMKQMSSTDTPLGTLNMLQEKQRSEKSPFIVLSGSKGFSSNSIIKPSQT